MSFPLDEAEVSFDLQLTPPLGPVRMLFLSWSVWGETHRQVLMVNVTQNETGKKRQFPKLLSLCAKRGFIPIIVSLNSLCAILQLHRGILTQLRWETKHVLLWNTPAGPKRHQQWYLSVRAPAWPHLRYVHLLHLGQSWSLEQNARAGRLPGPGLRYGQVDAWSRLDITRTSLSQAGQRAKRWGKRNQTKKSGNKSVRSTEIRGQWFWQHLASRTTLDLRHEYNYCCSTTNRT